MEQFYLSLDIIYHGSIKLCSFFGSYIIILNLFLLQTTYQQRSIIMLVTLPISLKNKNKNKNNNNNNNNNKKQKKNKKTNKQTNKTKQTNKPKTTDKQKNSTHQTSNFLLDTLEECISKINHVCITFLMLHNNR